MKQSVHISHIKLILVAKLHHVTRNYNRIRISRAVLRLWQHGPAYNERTWRQVGRWTADVAEVFRASDRFNDNSHSRLRVQLPARSLGGRPTGKCAVSRNTCQHLLYISPQKTKDMSTSDYGRGVLGVGTGYIHNPHLKDISSLCTS